MKDSCWAVVTVIKGVFAVFFGGEASRTGGEGCILGGGHTSLRFKFLRWRDGVLNWLKSGPNLSLSREDDEATGLNAEDGGEQRSSLLSRRPPPPLPILIPLRLPSEPELPAAAAASFSLSLTSGSIQEWADTPETKALMSFCPTRPFSSAAVLMTRLGSP